MKKEDAMAGKKGIRFRKQEITSQSRQRGVLVNAGYLYRGVVLRSLSPHGWRSGCFLGVTKSSTMGDTEGPADRGDQERDRETKRPATSVSFIEPGRRRGANHRCEHPGELTVDSSAAPSRGTGTTDMWTRCSPAHMSVSAPQRWDFVQLLPLITIGR